MENRNVEVKFSITTVTFRVLNRDTMEQRTDTVEIPYRLTKHSDPKLILRDVRRVAKSGIDRERETLLFVESYKCVEHEVSIDYDILIGMANRKGGNIIISSDNETSNK